MKLFFQRVIAIAVVVLSSLATTIWYALSRGQDLNWDQLNYHIGIPILLQHGTFWSSVAPAGLQSYFNPYLLELQLLAIQHSSAIGFAVGLAVLQSSAFILAGLVCGGVAATAERGQATILALLGFALCLLAPVSLSEAGTTFVDLAVSASIVLAFAALLFRGRYFSPLVSGILAGILLGAATALKVTTAIFALSFIGFALAGSDRPLERLKWLIASGAAAVVAFLAVGGSWFLEVGQRFGNPVFPLFNTLFRSPHFPPESFRDERFLPKSVWAIWDYPIRWFDGTSPTPALSSPSTEVAFVDVRWVFLVAGLTVFLCALAVSREWRRRRLQDPATGLIFAFAITYLAWLFMFGIHRYILALDILCGATLLALVMLLRPFVIQATALALLVAFAWKSMMVPDWGHIPWQSSWQTVRSTPLPLDKDSLVFLAGKPDFFVAASLPADARYVDITGHFDLRAQSKTGLAEQLKSEMAKTPANAFKMIDRGSPDRTAAETLASYGFTVAQCEPLRIAEQNLRLCGLAQLPRSPPPTQQ